MYKILISMAIACVLTVGWSADTGAMEVDKACEHVESVFARGSGQTLNQGDEFKQFIDQVEYRIKQESVNINFYELGSEEYGGALYPAVGVGWNHPIVSSGSWLSAGEGFKYGDSVSKGKKEFKAYIDKRMEKCGDSIFVIGGYSQGAQVVREGVEMLSAANKSKIAYVALFGDPKLHLPEGFGIFPDACRGKNLSPWRKDVPECRTYAGSLEAQRPFVSSILSSKTGLWCNRHDFVCGSSSVFWDQEGHGKYDEPGQAIDKAALEIAKRVKAKLPAEQALNINTVQNSGHGVTGHDIVFLIDINTSMAPHRLAIKNKMKSIMLKTKNERTRVAIGSYGGVQGVNGVEMVSNLDIFYSTENFEASSLDSWGLNFPAPFKGLPLTIMHNALDDLDWRYGATKSLYLFTDQAQIAEPDPSGRTKWSVLRRALEIDPVSIFPVVPDEHKDAYQEFADKSSGKVFSLSTSTEADQEIADTILARPVVLFALPEYSATANQEITFDVSESYALDSETVKYEWDFEGDLEFEKTTTTPTVDHTYATDGERIVQVRLTAANGMIANGSTVVKIGQREAPVVAAAPQNLTVTQTPNDPTSATLAWEAADTLASHWAVSVNGVKLGLLTADRTSITITDLERTEDITFGVASVTSEGIVSDTATTVLAKPVPVDPNPNPDPEPTPICNTGNFFNDLLCKATAWYKAFIQRITNWKPVFPYWT